MANYFDQFDESTGQVSKPANYFDQFDETKSGSAKTPPQNALTDTAQDVIAGALRIPGAITGLADIPAGLMGFDRPFDKATDYIGEKTGFQPGKLADSIQANNYSPERIAANQRLNQTWQDYEADKIGLGEALAETATNPRAALGNIVGSVPSMFAGGLIGKGAKGLGLVSEAMAPAVGEGAIMSGQAMDAIDNRVDPQKAAGLAAITGIGGAALSRLGGATAEKLSLVDPDTLVTNGVQAANRAPMSLPARVAGGFLSEGGLEELPQSLLEQGAQNIAEDKPITQGMARAGAEGLIAGGLMGAGFNAIPRQQTPEEKVSPVTGEPIPPEAETSGPLGSALSAGAIALPQPAMGLQQPDNRGNVPPDAAIEFPDGSTTTAYDFFAQRMAEHGDENLARQEMFVALNGPAPIVETPRLLEQSNIIYGESPTNAQNPEAPIQTETSQLQASTTGELQPTESAVSQSFAPTHELDDGTPVRLAQDSDGPYFEAADGQQFDFTPSATPLETPNADNAGSNASTNDQAATDASRGIGDGESAATASTGVAGSGAVSGRTSGDNGQLPGGELPSNVESGGALSDNTTQTETIGTDVTAAQPQQANRSIIDEAGIVKPDYLTDRIRLRAPDEAITPTQAPLVQDIARKGIFDANGLDVNVGYLKEQGVPDKDINRIKSLFAGNPGTHANPERFLNAILRDQYPNVDSKAVFGAQATLAPTSLPPMVDGESSAKTVTATNAIKNTTQEALSAALTDGLVNSLSNVTPLPDMPMVRVKGASKPGYLGGQQAFDHGLELDAQPIKLKKGSQEDWKKSHSAIVNHFYGALQKMGGVINRHTSGDENLFDLMRGYVATGSLPNSKEQRMLLPDPQNNGAIITMPLLEQSGQIAQPKIVLHTTGDKAELAMHFARQIEKDLPNLDDQTDVYVEPYGGSGGFTMNLPGIKDTNKPVIVGSFEPATADKGDGHTKSWLYGEIKKGTPEVISSLKSVIDNDVASPYPIIDEFRKSLWNGNAKSAGKRAQTAQENFDAFVAYYQRPNVVVVSHADTMTMAWAKKLAESGKRVTLIDDSNYAQLPNEAHKNSYNKSEYAPSGEALYGFKEPTYSSIVNAGGTVIATNHASGYLVGPMASRFAGNMKLYGVPRKKGMGGIDAHPGMKGYGHAQVAPEYLAIIHQGAGNNVININPQAGQQSNTARHSNEESRSESSQGTAATGNRTTDSTGNRTVSQQEAGGRRDTGTGTDTQNPSGTGLETGTRRGDVKFSIANQPSITALFDQLGKLKSAEKANKDTQALVNAHPQAERIRHVQNYWTDILVQHEKTSDNPNGKVTIQC